jgi:hypothetical protein
MLPQPNAGVEKRAFRLAGGGHAAGAFYLTESRPLTVGSAYPFPLARSRNLLKVVIKTGPYKSRHGPTGRDRGCRLRRGLQAATSEAGVSSVCVATRSSDRVGQRRRLRAERPGSTAGVLCPLEWEWGALVRRHPRGGSTFHYTVHCARPLDLS